MSFDSNPDPGRTLGQFGIAVLALVVGAALLFLAIDRFSNDPVASPQPSPSATASTAPTDTPTAVATEATPPASPPATESETSPETDTEEPSAEPSPAATTESPTAEPSPSEEPTEDETDETDETNGDRIDPGEISIQVLDAIKDGAGQARDIADEMEADGYRVVAYNPSSIIYDETTVFYTEGYEDEANQVADDYGWDEIVFNDILSEDVNVHVVVGLDEQ